MHMVVVAIFGGIVMRAIVGVQSHMGGERFGVRE
jgi:hypothetical protein